MKVDSGSIRNKHDSYISDYTLEELEEFTLEDIELMKIEKDNRYKIKEELLDQLSGWIWNKGDESNINIIADILAEQMGVSREYALDCFKMKILDDSQGIFVDLHGTNEGVERNGMDDDEYKAYIKISSGKTMRGDFDTIIESLASSFGVNNEDVKLLEPDNAPQLKPKHIWVEVNTVETFNILEYLKKIKASGIIVDAAIIKNEDTFVLTKDSSKGGKIGFGKGKFGTTKKFLNLKKE